MKPHALKDFLGVSSVSLFDWLERPHLDDFLFPGPFSLICEEDDHLLVLQEVNQVQFVEEEIQSHVRRLDEERVLDEGSMMVY